MAFEELKHKLSEAGPFVFAITPFVRGNWKEIDEEGIRKNIRFLIKNDVRAVFPGCGTGEIDQLTVEESKRVMKTVVEEVAGKALVIPGVLGVTTVALDMVNFAEKTGADAVLAFPPDMGFWRCEDAIYNYFQTLAKHSEIPIIAFNALPWSPEFTLRLSKIRKIVALKDEKSDLKSFSKAVRLVGDRFAWICGKDHPAQILQFYYMVGAQGFSCGLSNFAPQFEVEIHRVGVKKDYERMVELQKKVAPLSELRRKSSRMGKNMLKETMNMIGLAGGSIRPPQIPFTDEEREELRKSLRKYNFNV